jgi:hypothetical protein
VKPKFSSLFYEVYDEVEMEIIDFLYIGLSVEASRRIDSHEFGKYISLLEVFSSFKMAFDISLEFTMNFLSGIHELLKRKFIGIIDCYGF